MISQPTRRVALLALAALATAGRLRTVRAQGSSLPLTPECRGPEDVTPAQAEGPFYSPATPLKSDFRGDGPGTPLVLGGQVLGSDCRPIAGAMVDIWHANDAGAYDNSGYRFRGHQFSDSNGQFLFLTILPGFYGRRTRHIHLKAQAPGGRLLTTQLYFPDETQANARDGLFNPDLLLHTDQGGGEMLSAFDLVLSTG